MGIHKKKDEHEKFVKYKAQLVTQGFSQNPELITQIMELLHQKLSGPCWHTQQSIIRNSDNLTFKAHTYIDI